MTWLEELKRIATDGVFDQGRDSALVEEALPDLVRAVEALRQIARLHHAGSSQSQERTA